MKLYLAGPMRGYPEYNFPAFRAAASHLRMLGHEVWSPAERDEQEGFNPAKDEAQLMRYYMLFDLPAVLQSEAVAVLPGWRQSKGARLEIHVATVCDIPILNAESLEPERETVCEEAQRLVFGDRGATYGHPLDDFDRTSRMWAATLNTPVTAEQVALCMILLKVSRQTYQPKRDNVIDIAGYAECLQRIVEERVRRGKP